MEMENIERLMPEQLAALKGEGLELSGEMAAALGTSEKSVELSKAEDDLMNNVFEVKDITAAKGVLLSLMTFGSTEAVKFKAACKIIDHATVSKTDKLRAKLDAGTNKHATVTNIIVAVNKARELADRQHLTA